MNMHFPISEDAAASQPLILHKELVGEKKVMSYKLYKAVENGNVEDFVDMLKQECAEKNVALSDYVFDHVTGSGDSIIHVAADKGREQIVELICDHFSELLVRRNIKGDTPLHVAVRSKNSKIVNLILSKCETHDLMKDKVITREENAHGDSPLHEAVHSGDLGVVQVILDADKDVVHFLNKSRRSPLYLAVETGNWRILKLLLQIPFPADQPLPHCFGNSPLHAAILKRNPDLIEGILEKRPELVYLRDKQGNTPLHYVANIGYVEGVRIMLKSSIERLDQIALERNQKGHFPIHFACKRGRLEVVKEFLQHEWPIHAHILNQKGQNILHIAAKNGRSNVVQNLLRNSKNIEEFTINQRDNDGNTPLHLASINLFPKVLLLITEDKRTNLNLSNNEGLTARDIVYLALENEETGLRKWLARMVLKKVDVPLKVNDTILLSRRREQPPKKDLKNIINTYLVVATLIVTVTFAAAFTLPGGVYSSDDPNPNNRGMTILSHKLLFWVFTTFNTVSMYSSLIACGLMLIVSISVPELATKLTVAAFYCLVVAFITVPVEFMTASRLVMENNHALALVVTIIGVLYGFFFFLFMGFLFFPRGLRLPLLRQVGRLLLHIRIALYDYNDRPKDLSSKKLNKDKDDHLDEHV